MVLLELKPLFKCGAVAIGLVILFLPSNPPAEYFATTLSSGSRRRTWMRLDWIGAALVIGFFTTLLLPLQWGGNSKPWDSATVIALFIVSSVLFGAFLACERSKGDEAMIPLAVLTRKTPLGCAISGFFGYMVLMLATVEFIHFAARIQKVLTTFQSLVLSAAVVSSSRKQRNSFGLGYSAVAHLCCRCCGYIRRHCNGTLLFLVDRPKERSLNSVFPQKSGRYWWFLLLCPVSTAVGAGLLYTLQAGSPSAQLTGYQILYGAGIGGVFQNVLIAVQAEYADNEEMIPQATSFVSFCQILGGIVGISMAGSTFANELRRNLDIYAPSLPSTLKSAILESVTAIQALPSSDRVEVIDAYAKSLDPVFVIGVPAAILASLAAFIISNHDLKARSSTSAAMHT
ncbi:hypothetical protein BV22DRAFT_1124080 [Leucogyrophana mollusca]|uniref:Uncharacterized protein n=1 Tax=Leucogyrophana mollusca TaxID=85980 RepID=A0ACB8AUG9_9AGAM|nr:hypothetical protein BV22DRAFT_1124080 [Leucogyrophana mollusca]